MDALLSRALEVGLTLDPSTAHRVWAYFELLQKWNAKMNLTGLTLTPGGAGAGAIERLLIEPMLAAAHAGTARAMIDIGSGGGSPAIPFALAAASRPQLTMVEARERKSVFLREALRATGLTGDVRTARFEAVAAEPAAAAAFDVATIRAVRLDRQLLLGVAAVLTPGGQLFCFHECGAERIAAVPGLRWGSSLELVRTLKSCVTIATKV